MSVSSGRASASISVTMRSLLITRWCGQRPADIHPPLVRRLPPGSFAPSAVSAAQRPARSRPRRPRRRATARSAGVSTSHRRPGQAPVSSIAPERRCRADESGPNCGSSAAPNANSAEVPVPSRSATKLRRWCRAAAIASDSSCVCNAGKSPCSTTILENDSAIARSAAVMALFSGSLMALGRRVGQHCGAELDRRGRRGFVGRDDGDRAQRSNAGRRAQGVHQHGQHHVLPGPRRKDRRQPGLGGRQPLDGDDQADVSGSSSRVPLMRSSCQRCFAHRLRAGAPPAEAGPHPLVSITLARS